MQRLSLVFTYAIFAAISMMVNLLTQHIFFFLYSGIGSLYVGMFSGTLTGLVVKYLLDKKFIFNYRISEKKDHLVKFTMYSFMGVFTTLIFWGCEIFFHHIIAGSSSKYIGAVIGLTIGYSIKYYLDKAFVFVDNKR